jgi:hypothetical protein
MFSLTRENSYLPFDLLALGYVAGDLGRPDSLRGPVRARDLAVVQGKVVVAWKA